MPNKYYKVACQHFDILVAKNIHNGLKLAFQIQYVKCQFEKLHTNACDNVTFLFHCTYVCTIYINQ